MTAVTGRTPTSDPDARHARRRARGVPSFAAIGASLLATVASWVSGAAVAATTPTGTATGTPAFTAATPAVAVGAPATGTRELRFDVFLGDRPIGYQRFVLSPSGDGLRVETRAEFVVRVLGIKAYEYDHRNVEVWRGGCLQAIDSRTNSNGDQYAVTGRANGSAFVVDANSGEQRLAECVGTFAYWDKRKLLERTRLLNSQTGEYVPVQVVRLGPSRTTVGGRSIGVERYALRGKDLDITLGYEVGTGEWVSLESRLEGDRVLRYLRTYANAPARRG